MFWRLAAFLQAEKNTEIGEGSGRLSSLHFLDVCSLGGDSGITLSD